MDSVLIELNPNRLLLNPNFDGYKLSLLEIPCKTKQFSPSVDRILLKTSQYTLLHAKLYGLHNHLTGDPFDETGSVYFTGSDWNVYKTYIDPFSNEFVEPIIIWQIPKRNENERKLGVYNVSLKFVDETLAVLADGTGIFHIINTGSRNDDDTFTSLFSDEVIGQDKGFIIIDAQIKLENPSEKILHVLLQNIMQNKPEERLSTVLHWITLSQPQDQPWQQISLKQLKVTGDIQYAALEKDCSAIYVVSDGECKFTLNSDNPVTTETEDLENITNKYQWSQNAEDVAIKFVLPDIANKELISVKCESAQIEIKYNENILLCGILHKAINSDVTTWNLNNNCLEIIMVKNETGLMWPQLLIGDNRGGNEEIHSVEEIHERLAHLCSDREVGEQSGTTFNSQQLEECDFEADKIITFERLCGTTNKVTHRINLGSHQVLLTACLHSDLPPALGIRYDVDLCLWQPQSTGDNFSMVHEGTLLAFGYVQASKQSRKFSVCSPDLSYSVICESRHLFVYRQKIPISSSELKNRSTGRRINTIAQQQVVNISNDEIIGIYPTNKILFLLYETSVAALQL